MPVQRPSVVVFDVVGTMFSLSPVADALGALDLEVGRFLDRLLRDGFALTAAEQPRAFVDVARGAAAALAPDAAGHEVDRVVQAFADLPAHPDTEPALAALVAAGVRVATLSNGSVESTERLLEDNGLAGYVDRVFSVERAGPWKPSAGPYRHAVESLACTPADAALVAVHAWDVHGARATGMVAAWCSRLEGTYPDLFDPPDVAGADLVEVAAALLEPPAD